MAHNIEINEGIASYVENGKKERAWHGLGQVFDGPMTVVEALELSHANYQVGMFPLAVLTPDIKEHLDQESYSMPYFKDELMDAMVPGRNATVRLDTMKPLGIVSDSYGIVQNADAFKFIDTLCSGQMGEHAPVIETAGVLGNGERVFITAKFPDKIVLDNRGNDIVEMYVVFTTSHDGTGAVNCMVTPTRVVCNNTLNYAMEHNSGKLSLRHSSNIMSRLDLTNKENAEFAFKAMNMYDIYKKSLEGSFEHLANIRWAEKELDKILAEVVLSDENYKIFKLTGNIEHEDISTFGKNTYRKVKETLHSGVGQDYGERGTALWALNGLTSYYQNECRFKSDEYKFDSIQSGHVARKVQRAYQLLSA